MSDCTKSSDNKYFECPARMSDGRHFTDYRPSCDVETSFLKQNNFSDNGSYRAYLINNATTIMSTNRMYATTMTECPPSVNGPTPIPPFELTESCTDQSCSFTKTHEPYGIGIENQTTYMPLQFEPPRVTSNTTNQKNVCVSELEKYNEHPYPTNVMSIASGFKLS